MSVASTDPSTAADEFVMVPVPASRVPEVYKLLAQPTTDQSPSETVAGEREWTVADFSRLARDRRESVRRILLVLDVLAQQPDESVSLSDLAERTGLTRMEIRGALSGFTRICKSLWPQSHDEDLWPMWVSWGSTAQADQDGEAHYLITQANAKRWKQVRES